MAAATEAAAAEAEAATKAAAEAVAAEAGTAAAQAWATTLVWLTQLCEHTQKHYHNVANGTPAESDAARRTWGYLHRHLLSSLAGVSLSLCSDAECEEVVLKLKVGRSHNSVAAVLRRWLAWNAADMS